MRDAWPATGYNPQEIVSAGERLTIVRANRLADGLSVICKIANGEAPPQTAAGLRREFALLSRIDHPSIVRPLEMAAFDGREMLVLQDIGGTSLDKICRTGPLSISAFLDLAPAIVDGLAAIHAAGLVHQHVTPANIVWNRRSDAVNLIDFAIASELASEESEPYAATPSEGSLAYMAPEQTGRMNRAVDYRADFYGLGASFYRLLAGRPPFETDDPLDLIHSHIARFPVPVSDANPAVPDMLSAIIGWMMAKDPEDRCQSCFGLKADLLHCRDEWAAGAAIRRFALGRRDRRPVLRIPQRLYGRREQHAALAGAFGRVAEGGRELAMVCGYSGIGKSSLVNELQGDVARAGGMLVSGKFELLSRNIPCAPVIQAAGECLRRIGDRRDREAAALRERLIAALGGFSGVVAAVVPELDALIGPCPAPPPLGPIETENRFIHGFQLFIRALPAAGCPMVIFLDDLHWADTTSLKLLEAVARDTEIRHLMIVGAYRDNEVVAPHPLLATLSKVEEDGLRIPTIRLVGLDEAALTELLADTLQASPDAARPLARLVGGKSLGNPFYLNQYLALLERRRLVSFRHDDGQWVWDTEAIAREPMPDDLMALMLERLQDLPSATVSILGTAACIGAEFDLATLAAASGLAGAAAAETLWPALRAGLVAPIGSRYRYAGTVSEPVRYRFVHDRIEQAAYSTLDDAQKQMRHLSIGRRVRQAERDAPTHIFDVVHHLNKAAPLLSEPERLDLAELNLQAARQARASVAFGPALDLLTAGLALLPEDPWRSAYPLAVALHLETAEMAAWSCEDAIVQRTTAALLANIRTTLERVQTIEALARLEVSHSRFDEALDYCRQALAELGIRLPVKIRRRTILAEVVRTRIALGGKGEAELIALPPATDPVRLAIVRIMHTIGLFIYLIDPTLLAILSCRLVRACLAWGNHPYAADAYARFGMILTAMGAYDSASRYAATAKRIGTGPSATFACVAVINPWTHPMRDSLPEFDANYHQSMVAGDFLIAACCVGAQNSQQFAVGLPLAELRERCDTGIATLVKLRQSAFQAALLASRQVIACLTGEVPSPTHFHGPYLDEEVGIPALVSRGTLLLVKWSYDMLAYLNLLFGQHEEAQRYARMSQPYGSAQHATTIQLRAAAIDMIIEYVNLRGAPLRERLNLRRRVGGIKRKLRGAMKAHPGNFDHLHALLLAEEYLAHGQPDRALHYYGTAIASAHAERYWHDEGLAAERAGDLAMTLGNRERGEGFYRAALAAFRKWQADAKIAQLSEKIVRLFGTAALDVDAELRTGEPRAAELGLGAIDLSTVMRASQALAENVRLADLEQTMMRLVIANAGATRGVLLLPSNDGWRVEASAEADDVVVTTLTSLPLDSPAPLLAVRAVRQVAASQEPLVIDDMSADATYRNDPYVAASRPRSLLCVPLKHRNRLAGILYFENNLAAGVFSPDRVALLNLISTQIAISIDNARLYEDMEARVAERTAELQLRTDELGRSKAAVQGLLDSSGEGFLSFGADLRVHAEYSRACETMLGGSPAGGDAAELLFGTDPRAADLFRSIIARVLGGIDVRRRSLLLSLLPTELNREGRLLTAAYRLLEQDRVMVVLNDVTDERRLAELVAEQHRQREMIVAAVTDSRDFFGAVDSYRDFLQNGLAQLQADSPSPEIMLQNLYREIHTFKGLLGQFAFRETPRLLHELEGRLAKLRDTGIDSAEPVTSLVRLNDCAAALDADLDVLRQTFGSEFVEQGMRISLSVGQARRLKQLAAALRNRGLLDISVGEVRALLDEIDQLDRIDLAEALRGYDRVVQQAAQSMDKIAAPLAVEGGSGIELDPAVHGPFLRSLVHVFRNAVAHGIEDPVLRRSNGKPEAGRIVCTIEQQNGAIHLVIRDDGAGIDLPALRRRAAERGVAVGGQNDDQQLLNLVFLDGVSTSGEADLLSGRGIGLAAVHSSVRALKGDVKIRTWPARGTEFRFTWPTEGRRA